jgi:predicted transposase YbfD/YdcC
VSTWTKALSLVLGLVKTGEKSNETTVIPELLAALDVTGCMVTIDTMGCQKQIATGITKKQGEYVLTLKENHPETYTEVRDLFDAAAIAESAIPKSPKIMASVSRNGKPDFVFLVHRKSTMGGSSGYGLYSFQQDGQRSRHY